MLAPEARAAADRPSVVGLLHSVRRWFQSPEERSGHGVLSVLADARIEWEDPGLVALTDQHLVLHSPDRHRRASLRTVASVEWEGSYVWVRRRAAHDWLLYLKDERDAEVVWKSLAAAIDRH